MLGLAALASAAPVLAAAPATGVDGKPVVNQLNLHAPVTKIAEEIYDLHTLMMWVCVAIFLGVFGVMFYSLLKHRKSLGHKPATFHESTSVEIAWTIVPFLIVILMALPATKTVVAMKDTSNADLTIKVTGMQWKWGYDYLLKVDNPLVVPVDKKVRIITTANDVIHAWAVPAFGVKQDAIPGFVRDTWFRAEKVGDYYGQCAELCGKEHAYMPIHVKVLSAEDYTKWVEGEKKKLAAKADDPNKVWTLPELQSRGEKVYAANCAQCHQPNGKGGGPIKALDGSGVVLDADKGKQLHILLKGTDKGMPSWQAMSDTDIAAVSTYTKNTWSNATGQLVQPADVAAARKQ